jgi:L-seryl-tRNA(Ser) seleniumtransferase
LRAGADLVTASGDKLLGGPQAGLLLGRAELVQQVRRHPAARAMRVDKLTLAALEATLALYRHPELARREIPALAMLPAPVEALRVRAARLRQTLADRGVPARVVDSEGSVGGGAFPTARLASAALALAGPALPLERALRDGAVPVIGRITDDRLLLDLRSVPARDDARLADAVAAALAPH